MKGVEKNRRNNIFSVNHYRLSQVSKQLVTDFFDKGIPKRQLRDTT
jgi:hypothetical protein